MPQSLPHNTVVDSNYDLTKALLKPHPASPILIVYDNTHNSLLKLFDISEIWYCHNQETTR